MITAEYAINGNHGARKAHVATAAPHRAAVRLNVANVSVQVKDVLTGDVKMNPLSAALAACCAAVCATVAAAS